MKEFRIYKKIRQKASILGMPALNFWVFVLISALLFSILVFGISFMKIIVIALLSCFNFLFCRYFFNVELLGNIKIEDYYRNKIDKDA